MDGWLDGWMAGWMDGWMDGWGVDKYNNTSMQFFFLLLLKNYLFSLFFHPFQAIFPLFQAFWQDEPFEMPVLGKSEADSC